MRTIQLKVSDKIYDKFLWLLSRFSKEEIQVLSDESEFNATKKYLHSEFNALRSGKAELKSQSELENRLDRII
ncbi:hypothetical protein [Saccharicrinis aurantiacus]|uniref:hypothetical protein n=1 Tax=Saccharicrinis aurantiacus TaxID=1849719 RepID=UPI00248F88F8|nr:hypothetical protein [Saccharicrinis aurantiacus]